jgi:glycosyltransferase involved in cell wall biosynthesis
MKIGIVTTQFAEVGGVENVVRSISQEFGEQHEVHLITRDREVNTDEFEDCFDEVRILPNTESFLKFLSKGRKFFKNNQSEYDAFHFHNWSTILPAIGIGNNKVLTFHGTTLDVVLSSGNYHKAPLYWILEQIAILSADKFTSITESHLEPFYTRESKTKIIRNGVDTEEFRPREEEKTRLRDKFDVEGTGILIVGKHIEDKGHEKLIEAVSDLGRENTLMIPSSGPLTEKLKEEAEIRDVNAKFYGKVPLQELKELYSCADLFCLPSENEGLSLSMLESLSSGTPVAVSNIADNKNIVEGSQAGEVFEKESKDEITEVLRKLFSSNLSSLSENARNYALQNLEWSKIAEEYVEIYRDVSEVEK